MKLEFFFDCSSPWTYLAFEGVQPIAARHGVAITWRPILIGGVFNAVNQEVYAHRANPNPRRFAYMKKDLQDWMQMSGLKIGTPTVFPVNSVKAMRGALVALDAGKLVPYARSVFRHYWSELEDISQPEVLAAIAVENGFDATDFLQRIEEAAIRDRLRQNTDELIARNGFGTPTMYVNDTDMYFGNDRLVLVERALQRGG